MDKPNWRKEGEGRGERRGVERQTYRQAEKEREREREREREKGNRETDIQTGMERQTDRGKGVEKQTDRAQRERAIVQQPSNLSESYSGGVRESCVYLGSRGGVPEIYSTAI